MHRDIPPAARPFQLAPKVMEAIKIVRMNFVNLLRRINFPRKLQCFTGSATFVDKVVAGSSSVLRCVLWDVVSLKLILAAIKY